jgi:MoxR-like ATPase
MLEITKNKKITLEAVGSWPKTAHIFEEKSIWAINAALTAQRPLLIRGEPGVGKSQLARAAAKKLGRAFISDVVNSHSECQDLLWSFDAVARLGEAQALVACSPDQNVKEVLDPLKFLSPGPLWWLFNWESAMQQSENCINKKRKPEQPENWNPKMGSVLLIDEIDKAEVDLPNGLLETLGNGAFPVPYSEEFIKLPDGTPNPLIIITTNEERELPAAFLRRCLVLEMALPKEKTELIEWLVARGKALIDGKCSRTVVDRPHCCT